MSSQSPTRTVLCAQTAIRAPGSSQCNQHRGQDVAFVCNDCGGDLLCPQCIKQHQQHFLVSVSDVTGHQTRTQSLQTFINKVEKENITKLQKEIDLTKKEKVENSKHFKNLVLKVEKRSEEIKSWVDKMQVQYVTMLKEMEDHNYTKLEEYLSELNNSLKQVGDYLQKTKTVLQVGGPIQVYDACTEIKTSDLKLPRVPKLKSADFRENSSNQMLDQLREILGSFSGEIENIPQVSPCQSSRLSLDYSMTVPTPPASAQTSARGVGNRQPQVSGTRTQNAVPIIQNTQQHSAAVNTDSYRKTYPLPKRK